MAIPMRGQPGGATGGSMGGPVAGTNDGSAWPPRNHASKMVQKKQPR